METQLPSPKVGGVPPIFGHISCGQMAGWIKMPLGREVGLSLRDTVLDRNPASLPQKEAEPPNFRPVYCGPKWLDGSRWHLFGGRPRPIDVVLDGDPAPLQLKGARPTVFGPRLLWPTGWMEEYATWYGSIDLGPGHIVLDGDPASPRPRKGHSAPPLFGPCLLWPRSPISATAELLLLQTINRN